MPSDIEKGYFSPAGASAGAHPVQTPYTAVAPAPQFRKFANPAPLGLCAFAATTFLLSLANIQADNVKVPNVVVGMGLAYGGGAQILAGMWEFAVGNTFGATAFTSYGAFWISFACILLPGTGIAAAYEDKVTGEMNVAEFEHALGFFLAGWLIFTTLMLPATFKSNIALASVFGCLDITFLLLTVSKFQEGETLITWQKAGGSFGLVTAALAWYTAAGQIITKESSYFSLPLGDLSRRG